MILLQRAPADPILGEKGVPEEIVTFVVAIGIVPQPQLVEVFQPVLVVPSHVPVALHVFTYNTPVEVKVK